MVKPMHSCAAGSDDKSNFLRSELERGAFVCTAELVLGRDHSAVEAEEFVRDAAQQANGIRVISLTDLPGGNPALPPEAFVSYVREHGLTPIAHLSGKDGNRSFLEARLHALARLGVENVLALTGDAQREGFAGKAKAVHDLDSVLILWLIRALRGGLPYKAGTKQLSTIPHNFFAGAVVNPYKIREPDLMMQFYKLRLKVAAGADFIVTQLGYNLRKLYELKQYMSREGIGHVPVLANIYVPTARIARMMRSGEIAGCVIPDELMRRLEGEKKPERLERAALMLAAVKDLGFAGAHIGGFGLSHRDFMMIDERSSAMGGSWRGRMEELTFSWPKEFYLFPPGRSGFSDGEANYQIASHKPRASMLQRLSDLAHRYCIKEDSTVARFFQARLKTADGRCDGNRVEDSLWSALLAPSAVYRKATLGCVNCGDCVQDHLDYAGCSTRWCYKELRNGPCGGSGVDGMCEARHELPCVWNLVYSGARAMGDDPNKFAKTLIPPRDWDLDGTNALVNRFGDRDNLHKRVVFGKDVNEGE